MAEIMDVPQPGLVAVYHFGGLRFFVARKLSYDPEYPYLHRPHYEVEDRDGHAIARYNQLPTRDEVGCWAAERGFTLG